MDTPNLEYIKEISGGDVAFQKNILLVLKKEFSKEVLLYKNNYKAQNYIKCANNVHKIKHKISILGMIEDTKLASVFEIRLKNSKIELNDSFLEILDKIDVFLKTNHTFN